MTLQRGALLLVLQAVTTSAFYMGMPARRLHSQRAVGVTLQLPGPLANIELPGPLAELLGPPAPTDVSARALGSKGFVITGGAGGVGYAYADELLELGHGVVICDIKDPTAPVAALKSKHGEDAKIFGFACDVSSADSVEALGAFAVESLGTIHYWVNNAGINGGRREN